MIILLVVQMQMPDSLVFIVSLKLSGYQMPGRSQLFVVLIGMPDARIDVTKIPSVYLDYLYFIIEYRIPNTEYLIPDSQYHRETEFRGTSELSKFKHILSPWRNKEDWSR